MKIAMPSNFPCLRCGGDVIKSTDEQLVCSRCGQFYKIGPYNCLEAEFEGSLCEAGREVDKALVEFYKANGMKWKE